MWFLTNSFRTLSPLGLVAVGAVAGAVGVPVIRKTLRGLALITVKGAMSAGDAVRKAGGSLGKSWEEMVREAGGRQVKTDDGTFVYKVEDEISPAEKIEQKNDQKSVLEAGGGDCTQIAPGNKVE